MYGKIFLLGKWMVIIIIIITIIIIIIISVQIQFCQGSYKWS